MINIQVALIALIISVVAVGAGAADTSAATLGSQLKLHNSDNDQKSQVFLAKIFDMMVDADSSGSASKEEMNAFYTKAAYFLEGAGATIMINKSKEEIFALYDVNGDGVVSKEEFIAHLKTSLNTPKDSFDGMSTAFFKNLDENGIQLNQTKAKNDGIKALKEYAKSKCTDGKSIAKEINASTWENFQECALTDPSEPSSCLAQVCDLQTSQSKLIKRSQNNNRLTRILIETLFLVTFVLLAVVLFATGYLAFGWIFAILAVFPLIFLIVDLALITSSGSSDRLIDVEYDFD
jgi:Ca2+-binding EF-hand superfamily protein